MMTCQVPICSVAKVVQEGSVITLFQVKKEILYQLFPAEAEGEVLGARDVELFIRVEKERRLEL